MYKAAHHEKFSCSALQILMTTKAAVTLSATRMNTNNTDTPQQHLINASHTLQGEYD